MGILSTILLIILTIILPPAGVLVKTGCSSAFLLNIILTLLGYVPGKWHLNVIIKLRIGAWNLYHHETFKH